MRTVLITGSTDGIGRQTALELASRGFKVIVHGRNLKKVLSVVDEIKEKTGNKNISGKVADFSDLNEVKEMANELIEEIENDKGYNGRLDVLINNAGTYERTRKLNPDGYELTLTVNHLAHFLLTNLILDIIKKSDDGRIINVSSMIHAGSIDFDNLNCEHYYDGSYAYSISKLCNILFTYRLARMLDGEKVTVNCLHPGVINTKLLRAGWGGGGSGVEEGAKTCVYLATSDEVKGITGRYFVNMKAVKSKPITYDLKVQDRCWDESMKMVGKYLD